MFRLDEDTVVDATTRGNIARFINHSCDVRCRAYHPSARCQESPIVSCAPHSRSSPRRFTLAPKQPNSYCKVVTVEQLKRIAIFAKRDLAPNEEITYDYKFATEKDKIDCYCGAARCIGRMN